MTLDEQIDALEYALLVIRQNEGWREALRQLKKASQMDESEPMRPAAVILHNDYNHLREHGLCAYQAVDVVLS